MSDTKEHLQGLMGRYTTENATSPDSFEETIRTFLEMDDWRMEGYSSPDHQRQKSIKFEWGHNHNFGTFKLDGVLGDRHIDILATFIDDFGLPKDLSGKQVLDVGVWCGGTSLLLAAMGAQVVSVEEVSKYARCADFLGRSFSLPLTVVHQSLYLAELGSQFDYVIFPGVLYHLTDPILALRILFNALKDGGKLFIETAAEPAAVGDSKKTIRYVGSEYGFSSWFVPSLRALEQMLYDVGFSRDTLDISAITSDKRMFAVTKRTEWRDMLRAGLSRPNIK